MSQKELQAEPCPLCGRMIEAYKHITYDDKLVHRYYCEKCECRWQMPIVIQNGDKENVREYDPFNFY